MKKNILAVSILLGLSNFAFANGYIVDLKERKIPIQTNAKIYMVKEEEVNLNAALHMKDIQYFKSIVSQDPEVVTKINRLRPLNPVGFAVIPKPMFDVVYAASPSFINSINGANQNYITFMVTEWFEKLETEYAKNRMQDIARVIKEQMPRVQTPIQAFLERPTRKDLEDILVFAIGKMNTEALNSQDDIYKNTSLHYLAHKRLYKPMEALLNNRMFYRKQALNKGNENALFMLLDTPCNMKSDEKDQKKVLDLMLKHRINPLQRNKSGYTFAAFVLGDERYKHLQETLLENLSPVQKRLAEQDAQRYRVAKEISRRTNQNFDFYLSFNHLNTDDFYTCKANMLELINKN